MKKTVLVFPLFVCLALGQRLTSLQGDVTPASNDIVVELINSESRVPIARAVLAHDGHFEFRGIEEGHYELRVSNQHGDVLHSEYLSALQFAPSVAIHLRTMTRASGPVSGFVSLKQLSHEGKKSFRQAAKHFAAASTHMNARNFSAARNELLKTIELEPEVAAGYINLAIVDMLRGDPLGAEQCALRALELDPKSDRASYLTAFTRYAQGRGPRPVKPASLALDPNLTRYFGPPPDPFLSNGVSM